MTHNHSTALDIDLYHLDAAYIAWKSGTTGKSTFDLFTRSTPFGGGFMLTAGLDLAAEHIANYRFEPSDLDWLRTIKHYDEAFFDLLAELKFSGDILAMPEGEIAFAHEPILRVTAPFVEAILLEAGLLRTIGISTLLATKAARLHIAADGRSVADFAYRRAHEPMWAARSGYIGGVDTTSYVGASKRYGIPGSGTIPHAIVQAFDDEETAFREIAAMLPEYTLLLDTYDVDKGIDNAIAAARNEAATGSGHRLTAVRIDSGDLGEWSRLVKSRLMAVNMPDVKVLVSGDIDEFKIRDLLASGAPIDGFGVGGNLGVGLGTVASGTVGGVIGAVYKLAWIKGESGASARMKIAGSKSTWPGEKRVYRVGDFDHDVITLEGESAPAESRPLLQAWMANGAVIEASPTLVEMRERAQENLAALPPSMKQLTVEAPYPVEFSDEIEALRAEILAEHKQ